MLNRCFEFTVILLSDNWSSLYFIKVFVEMNSIRLIFNIILYLILFDIMCALVSLKKIYNIV